MAITKDIHRNKQTMKKYLLASLFTLFSLIAFAQEATTDYIYCPNGFKVMEVECPYRPGYDDRSTCIGLYTADGSTKKIVVR